MSKERKIQRIVAALETISGEKIGTYAHQKNWENAENVEIDIPLYLEGKPYVQIQGAEYGRLGAALNRIVKALEAHNTANHCNYKDIAHKAENKNIGSEYCSGITLTLDFDPNHLDGIIQFFENYAKNRHDSVLVEGLKEIRHQGHVAASVQSPGRST